MKKHILILTVLVLNTVIATATHLLGGNIAYKYVSSSKGKITYKVTISLYRDCKESDVPFDSIIKVGIYYNNVQKNLMRTERFTITRKSPLPTPCYTSLSKCIELGIYEKTLTLDSTSLGIYLSYVRCCRAKLMNVKNDASSLPSNGFTILGYIAPTKFKNTSPQFATHPFPFYRINIPSTDYLGAFDDDGDSLVYKIATPYQGATGGNSEPDPTNIMGNLESVSYVAGYNANKPLGSTGTVSIDSTTGMLTVVNSVTEAYAFCIEIKEYRNGELIGVHRRDYPLTFINLPPNPYPVKISLAKSYVYSGNKVSLCWNICPRSVPEYTIERREPSTGWTEIKTRELNNFYNDNIDFDKWYYYRIKAVINTVTVISNIDTVYASSSKTGSVAPLNHKIHIYPNPADYYLNLDHSNTQSYLIYDMNGRLLKSYSDAIVPVSKIDIHDLFPGLYVIYIKTETGWLVEKFAKIGDQ